MLPPLRLCSTVFAPSHWLENQRAPLLLHTVMPVMSALPGSPLSVIVSWIVAFPSIEVGASGLVMSWMLAFPLNVPMQGAVAEQPPDFGMLEPSDVIALLLIWYTR